MKNTVISVEHLTKQYDLGVIGTGTLSRDLERWWARTRGKPDPYAIIGRDQKPSGKNESILALDDVSFTVQQGEALGIIGRNGAGKSTLLKILSRVTAPTSGVVKVRGRIGSLLEVGTGFHPELTGRENVYLNGAILGMRKAEVSRKFDEIVAFSGVERFIDTPVKRYSSGMYVRLAFAVAAHLDPEILIVDEVLAVGDAEFQKKCLGKMSDVAGEGRTVLFVSHNMTSIQKLCTKSLLLDGGAISSVGETEEVISDYIQGNESLFSSTSLENMTERRGNQILKFTRVEILDVNHRPIKKAITGRDVIFRFHYQALTPGYYSDVCVSFVVKDGDYSLINLNTIDSGYSELEVFTKGFIECHWPNLNLTSRIYNCSLYCAIKGVVADWIELAFKLDVENGDFYKSGKNIGFQSKFLTTVSWKSDKEQ